MTHTLARSGMSLLCSVAIYAGAAEPEPTAPADAAPTPPTATHAPLTIIQHGSSNAFRPLTPPAATGEVAPGEQPAKRQQNVLRFVTGEEADAISRRMKERLTDPEQRAAFRAEQRAAQVSQNLDLGRMVGLDSATQQQLIDLLTDQQMERLDQAHSQARSSLPDLQQYAEEITRQMNALRDLLGEEKLERFQDFQMTSGERGWVHRLSARLAPPDRLQPDQVDRLVALKREQSQRAFANIEAWRIRRLPTGPLPPLEEMQRDARRQSRVANENSWRRRKVDDRAVEQKAAAFLTSTQLAELAKVHSEEHDQLRGYVEAARAEAGLSPNIPEEPEQAEEAPKLLEVQLQVEVRLTVNREPTAVTRTVHNGESFTFQAAPGLIIEATPSMYESDWVDVHLKYYEEGVTGRRRLSGNSIFSAQARQADGSLGSTGSGGTVISGRKGYAVEATVNAKVL